MLGSLVDARQKEAINALMKAMKEGDEEQAKAAWTQFHDSIVDKIKDDYEMMNGDTAIMAQRGYRQLTKRETEFYQKWIASVKSKDAKQEFTDLMNIEGGMPETIFTDVYKDLVQEHPLLSKINFQNVRYLTKWILNDHTKQSAAWGKINSEIEKEISSGFRTIDVALFKLSAFTVIPLDMVDLGPEFLDNYVRTILKEALYCACENACVTGNGVDCPIGLDRDISEGVSHNDVDGYPRKTPVKIKSFRPEEYGPVLAKLAVNERGNMRKFDEVTLICNQVDYLSKVMPATVVLTAAGTYQKDLFPFPTSVVKSNELKAGEAILFLPEEYFFGLGTSKDGKLESTDVYKFLEDVRTYKIKLHGNGRAFDNTVALLLDISELDPAYITVENREIPVA